MKSPDVVFNELGKLYDFYKEIARFRLKKTRKLKTRTRRRGAFRARRGARVTPLVRLLKQIAL